MRRRRPLPRGLSAVVEGGSDLGEVVPDVAHHGAVALGRRFDAEREEQGARGRARVATLTQHRVQALLREMREDQVDHAPRIEALAPGLVGPVIASAHRRLPGSGARALASDGRTRAGAHEWRADTCWPAADLPARYAEKRLLLSQFETPPRAVPGRF